MVPPEFGEPLVEGMRNDVVIARVRGHQSKEERLEFKSGTHPTEFEVAEPQLSEGETGFLAIGVKCVEKRFNHRIPMLAESLAVWLSGSSTRPGSATPGCHGETSE